MKKLSLLIILSFTLSSCDLCGGAEKAALEKQNKELLAKVQQLEAENLKLQKQIETNKEIQKKMFGL